MPLISTSGVTTELSAPRVPSGTLGVLGDANLFFINPNGIVFGPNARLDVGGSFFASTADGLVFENGFEFNATDPQAPPLLTVNIPIGLRFRDNPGSINNQSVATALNNNNNAVGLQVQPGNPLTLVGGDVNLSSGIITAAGGRVELGGISAAGTVGLNNDGSLSFPESVARADVSLTNGAFVDVSGEEGGNIAINTRNLEILGESEVQGGTFASLGLAGGESGDIVLNATGEIAIDSSTVDNSVEIGNAGNIDITTGNLFLTNGAQLSNSTRGQGDAGNIVVQASDTVSLTDTSLILSNVGSTSRQPGVGVGKVGNIFIEAREVSLTNNAQLQAGVFTGGQGEAAGIVSVKALDSISFRGTNSGIFSDVESQAVGDGSEIQLSAPSVSLTDGAILKASNAGRGNGGSVSINATDTVSFDGSSALSKLEDTGVGNGGSIDITARSLFLTDGAELNSDTSGEGDAGLISVQATEKVELSGDDTAIFSNVNSTARGNGGRILIETGELSVTNEALLSSGTLGQGNGGNIRIVGRTVNITESIVNASSLGLGDAGSITIQASDTISLSESTGIVNVVASLAGLTGIGRGGDINLQARSIFLADGAQVATNNVFAQGRAGDIRVSALDFISVTGGARLQAATVGQGDAGNVTIQAGNAVSLNGESGIVSDVLSSSGIVGSGKGGDITIYTGQLRISEGADVTADSSGEGNAGNILVQARDSVEVTGAGSFLSAEVLSGATGRGGDLSIETEQLNVRDQAQVTVKTAGSDSDSRAGNLTIDTGQLLVSDGAQISASTTGAGKGGELNIHAREKVELSGTGLENFDEAIGLALETGGDVEALRKFLQEEAPLSTATFSTGEAGKIEINTPSLVLRDGAILSSTTFGGENTGGIAILKAESVELLGSGLVTGSFNPNAEEAAEGGNIVIDTGKLSLRDGGRILTTTFSQGKGGDVVVRASESIELGSTPAGVILPTTINASSVFGAGPAGDVTIETPKLLVRDGAQIVTTSGSDSVTPEITEGGPGGNIEVRDSESVEISGTSPDGQFSSALTAESFSDSRAGDLTIETGQMNLSDVAQVTVSNRQGQAGNLEIAADSLSLDRGSITAKTGKSEAEEEGANITLQISDLLTLSNESPISAEAFDPANGGNIDINADFIVAFPRDNQIIANANKGRGGNIDITTNFIFGLPNFLDIDASSNEGIDGVVEISNLQEDPSSGLIELPEDVVVPTEQIAQNPCTLGLDSEFIITGRGGLPPNPSQVLSSDSARVGWVDPAPVESRGGGESTSSQNPPSKIHNPIVPARGWVLNDKGEAVLVGYDPTHSGLQRSRSNPPVCPAP